jgi:hypothetical protein
VTTFWTYIFYGSGMVRAVVKKVNGIQKGWLGHCSREVGAYNVGGLLETKHSRASSHILSLTSPL